MFYMTSINHPGGTSPPEKEQSVDELILAVGQGDQNAFEELYRVFSSEVYAYALAVLKNPADAQDVLQDCFVALHNAAPRYKDTGKGQHFVMTIAANLCRMAQRKEGRRAELAEEDWMPYLEDQSALSPDDRLLLKECMTALTAEEREILTLHAVSGFKHREIAGLLGLPLSTVLSKYNRAVKKLRKQFGEGEKT